MTSQQGGITMKGRIYPYTRGERTYYKVRFGSEINKTFTNLPEAERFLTGIRFKSDENTFDPRDYKADNPLLFETQAKRYLQIKAQKIKGRSFRNIERTVDRAVHAWAGQNIKAIGYAEIEDFLYSFDVSDKTRSDIRSAVHCLFAWASRREHFPMPDFPEIKFELGWRNIIGIETQQAILQEIHRLYDSTNPKVAIAIEWLAKYIAFRPAELLNLRERHINVNGMFVVPSPKENVPKLITMDENDIDLIKTFPRALPDVHFFRHTVVKGSTRPGDPFGTKYLYKVWKKACKNLGVEGVDLYGGTRHSTASALGEHFSVEQIMKAGSMHKTNKAALRYIQNVKNESLTIYQKVKEMQNKAGEVVEIKGAKIK